MLSCRDMAPLLSAHSPTACGGKVVAPATKGDCISSPAGRLYGFPRAKPGCPVFAAKGGIKNGARRRRTSPAQRYYITPEGGSPQPACKAKPITGRTLGAQGQRPGGAINLHARKGVSTFGNTVSRRQCHNRPQTLQKAEPPKSPAFSPLRKNMQGF